MIQNFKRESVIADNGYTTGVAYINNCTAKPIKTVKSLYLVVIDEMMMPKPRPRPAMMRMMVGMRANVERVEKVEGVERVEEVEGVEGVEEVNLNQSMAARSNKN